MSEYVIILGILMLHSIVIAWINRPRRWLATGLRGDDNEHGGERYD